MKQQLDRLDTAYAIVVVPLLIESAARDLVDRVLVVDCPEELQIARTIRRDGTDIAVIESILAAQLDRGSRLSAADDVIENNASEEALEEAVFRLDRRYRTDAARIASGRRKMKE
jgi:dephospho-CoA kinase